MYSSMDHEIEKLRGVTFLNFQTFLMPQNKYNTMITIPNNHNSLPFDSSTIFPNQPQPLQMNHSFGPNGLLSNQVFGVNPWSNLGVNPWPNVGVNAWPNVGVNTWSNLNSYEAFPCESSSSNMRHNNADVSDKNAHEMGTNNQVMNTVTPENTVTKKTSKDRNLDFMKSQWTPEEDSLLVQLVEKYGLKKWAHIARILSGRVGKQCRERWYNYLKPDIKREIWTEDEDKILINSHMKFGNKWSEIAKTIPGRTENSIKNHWNATRRRHISNYRFNKNTQSTLLYDYIKSLNLDNLVDHGSSTSSSSTAPAVTFSVTTIPTAAPEVPPLITTSLPLDQQPMSELGGGIDSLVPGFFDFSNEEIPITAAVPEPPLITTHQEDSFLPLDDQQLMLVLGGGNDGLVPEFDFSNEEIPTAAVPEPPLITTHQEDSFLPLDDQQLMLELGGGNDGLVAEFDFSNEEIPTAAEPPLITTHQEDSFLPLDDQQLMLELGGGNDGLVPEFDFSNEEIPDLGCIDEMFQDDYNLESLLDGFH